MEREANEFPGRGVCITCYSNNAFIIQDQVMKEWEEVKKKGGKD